MKILYITGEHPDYQSDTIFHGLRSLFGDEVVDIPKLDYMYESYPQGKRIALYGRGFTIFCNLEDIPIDRTDFISKIRNKFYDYVIYGSVWRSLEHVHTVLEAYPRDKVCFIDGEDSTAIPSTHIIGCTIVRHLAHDYHYFKRELNEPYGSALPISFSIPKEKIIDAMPTKTQAYSQILPGHTYVYRSEEDYYAEYQKSYFGLTRRKAGWDSLRHYEILANYCAPYFINLGDCPSTILFRFPKEQCLEINQLGTSTRFDSEKYHELIILLVEYLRNHLTTEKMASYMIDTMRTSIVD